MAIADAACTSQPFPRKILATRRKRAILVLYLKAYLKRKFPFLRNTMKKSLSSREERGESINWKGVR
jgi:hypothetical protein